MPGTSQWPYLGALCSQGACPLLLPYTRGSRICLAPSSSIPKRCRVSRFRAGLKWVGWEGDSGFSAGLLIVSRVREITGTFEKWLGMVCLEPPVIGGSVTNCSVTICFSLAKYSYLVLKASEQMKCFLSVIILFSDALLAEQRVGRRAVSQRISNLLCQKICSTFGQLHIFLQKAA